MVRSGNLIDGVKERSHVMKFSRYSVQHYVNGDGLNIGQNGFTTHYWQNIGPILKVKQECFSALCRS